MTSQTVKRVSECFVKPLHDLSHDTKQPIYLTPFELILLNHNYSQKGLFFGRPPPQGFSVNTFLDDLRISLSATLAHFYPLAARLATRKQENPPSYVIYIDPENSPGVKFIHATVDDVTVSDILMSNDVPSVVHSFFDLNDAINHDGHILPLLSIQVTELIDGIFIGGSVNHCLADGASFWHFMTAWSEIYRSRDLKNAYRISRPPSFKRWILEGYDPITSLPFTHQDQFIQRSIKPRYKERFFHFSSAAVSKLKAKANAECNMQRISSLQAVSALLWRCITRVRQQPGNSVTLCTLTSNNRARVKPPLSDDDFCSFVDPVSGTATVEDLLAHGLGWAALKIHEAVRIHDNEALKSQTESWYRNPVVFKTGVPRSNVVYIGSSPKFDMYGCEFGLGKALAARSGLSNKSNGGVTMYPGCEGGGSMDAEVCLLPEHMRALEYDEELISALC